MGMHLKQSTDVQCSVTIYKQHNTQHSGHTGQQFQTEKTIEIQQVRPTEVCGKV